MTPDLRLQLVTSGTGRDTVEIAASAAGAGAGVVQVRAKGASTRELLDLTTAVAAAVATAAPTTVVIVDDRADVAYAARRGGHAVHGVHLGQSDLPVADARAMLGPDALIGLTAGSIAEVAEAESRVSEDRPDLLGVGQYRSTPTKPTEAPPLGLAGYPPLLSATTLPVVAIGGIEEADVIGLRDAGVSGVAVVRAVMAAADPAEATRALLRRWDLSAP